MIKHAFKKGTILLLGTVLLTGFSYSLKAEESLQGEGKIIDVDEQGDVKVITPEANDISDELKAKYNNTNQFEVVSKIGNYKQVIGTYDTYEEALKKKQSRSRMRAIGDLSIEANGLIRDISNGVVDFNTKDIYTTTYYYENADKTGVQGYLSGTSNADGAYLGTNADGTMVKFRMSGITAWVSIQDVIIRDVNNSNKSYYKIYVNKNTNINYLCHYISFEADATKPSKHSGGVVIGKAPAYLSKGVEYYSYDGIYFYTNYQYLISDYKAGTYTHAINANDPFYNYFQYLPFRTKTNFTAAQLDKVVDMEAPSSENKAGVTSVMRNTGKLFLDHEATYGTNAALMFAGGVIESRWGTSDYAVKKNNLFGHRAFDSNPDLASSYPSINDGIKAHAKAFLSEGYLNPLDYRYFGPHFGNKNGGLNFKYASDPNLGEKYASIMYDLEHDNDNKNIDFGKQTIGITTGSNLSVRKEASTSSKKLYSTSSLSSQPVIILEKVTGESVNGNNIWYKIQSDAVLKDDRSSVLETGKYDFNRDYAYVSSAYINVIYDEKNITGDIPEPSYKKGDVNSNGKIDAADYLMVMDSILGKFSMNDTQKKAADVNGNGKTDSADYLMIMDHILGKYVIK